MWSSCCNTYTSWCFLAKIDCSLCLKRIKNAISPPWGFLSSIFNISCIKHDVTNSIVNSFINIVSKTVIKYLYKGNKLSSKIMTISSLFTGTSRQVSWFASVLTFLMWSNKPSPYSIMRVKILGRVKIMLDKSSSHIYYKGSSTLLLVHWNSLCTQVGCTSSWA